MPVKRGTKTVRKRKTSPVRKRKTSPVRKRKTSPVRKRKTSPVRKRKNGSRLNPPGRRDGAAMEEEEEPEDMDEIRRQIESFEYLEEMKKRIEIEKAARAHDELMRRKTRETIARETGDYRPLEIERLQEEIEGLEKILTLRKKARDRRTENNQRVPETLIAKISEEENLLGEKKEELMSIKRSYSTRK